MSLTVVYRPGANGTPTDFTSPLGGAIDMSHTISGSTLNVLMQPLAIPTSSSVNYYDIFYLSLESANTISSARIFNRGGAIVNASAGVASFTSTSPLDTGIMLVTGKVSGVYAQDTITLLGSTAAFGTTVFDINTVVRYEYILSGSPSIPFGNIVCNINSAQCALMYGSLNNLLNGGVRICSAEFKYALATAKNTTISATNVLNAPGTDGDTSSIGSFVPATLWTSADASIAVPTGGMVNTDYIGVCKQFTAFPNIFPTKNGNNKSVACLTGTFT